MPTLLERALIRIDMRFLPDCGSLFSTLLTTIAWDERMRARKAASFGVPYNHSGMLWPAAEFPADILPVLQRVSERQGYEANNCLAHYYPGGASTMGFHADATDDLAAGTGIAVVSLGAERAISFRGTLDRERAEHYPLPPGSLLWMSAEMQAEWQHAILPAERVVAGRISLTFRRMNLALTTPDPSQRH